MSSDTPQATQMTICAGPNAIPQEVGHWYSAHHVAKLETELAEARQQLVEQAELAETGWAQARRLALELECLILSCNDTAAVSKWWDSANEALDQFRAVAAIEPPYSTALAEHDAEVRRKALGEVLAMWEAPYNGERFIDRLRRMANVQVQRDSGGIIAGGSAGTTGWASCDSERTVTWWT